MQSKVDETNILVYTVGNKIYFLASSIIVHGLFLLKNDDGTLVKQKVISDSNSDYLTITTDTGSRNKTISVCIISSEINYEKKLIL